MKAPLLAAADGDTPVHRQLAAAPRIGVGQQQQQQQQQQQERHHLISISPPCPSLTADSPPVRRSPLLSRFWRSIGLSSDPVKADPRQENNTSFPNLLTTD
ncbi:hypothetical protein E4U21_002068 [Claviceps maximensis]|nr:hypothetical protein E4U21_002068 [Claviceps maximensis]